MKKVKQIVKQNRGLGGITRRTRGSFEANCGAGDGIRTHDVLLGKQALYR